MSGFVHAGSPLAPLLTHLAVPHAAQFGALIALCELWVGLSALLGLLTRLGALGGLAISFTFYLTATWTVRPYFLGADLPYALGWLTLALAGPGIYSLDEYFFGRLRRARAATVQAPPRKGRSAPAPVPLTQDPVARSAFMRALGTGATVVAGGGIAGGVAKLLTPSKVFAHPGSALPGTAPSPATGAGTPAVGTGAAAAPQAPAGMTFLGNVKGLLANSAGQYTDPTSGDPALLVHLPDGRFVAYDAGCTHAGCTVEYDPTQHQLACPCCGAVFDPAHGAQVLAGPAPQPLAALEVRYGSTRAATPSQKLEGAAARRRHVRLTATGSAGGRGRPVRRPRAAGAARLTFPRRSMRAPRGGDRSMGLGLIPAAVYVGCGNWGDQGRAAGRRPPHQRMAGRPCAPNRMGPPGATDVRATIRAPSRN